MRNSYCIKTPSLRSDFYEVKYKSTVGWLTVKSFPLDPEGRNDAQEYCRILNLEEDNDDLYLKNIWNYTHDLPVLIQ